jgi:hypothetical protein
MLVFHSCPHRFDRGSQRAGRHFPILVATHGAFAHTQHHTHPLAQSLTTVTLSLISKMRDWFSLTPRAQVTEKRSQSFPFLMDTPDKSIAQLTQIMLDLVCVSPGAPCGEGGLSYSITIDRSSEQFLSSYAQWKRTYQQANGVQQKQRHDAPLQRSPACDSTMEYSKRPTARMQQCCRSWTHWDDSACAWRLLSAANQPTEAFSLIIPCITTMWGLAAGFRRQD